MAAGSQTRWNYYKNTPYKIKQLIKVKGEVLIERLQRQFPGAVVITTNPDIRKHSQQAITPEHHETLINTILSTHKLWGERNTIILGDVLFMNDEIVNKIKNCQDDIMFFGNIDEIFAVVFTDNDKMHKHLQQVGKGKLWNLYRSLTGLSEHKITSFFTFTHDARDFDCVLQYLKYLKSA